MNTGRAKIAKWVAFFSVAALFACEDPKGTPMPPSPSTPHDRVVQQLTTEKFQKTTQESAQSLEPVIQDLERILEKSRKDPDADPKPIESTIKAFQFAEDVLHSISQNSRRRMTTSRAWRMKQPVNASTLWNVKDCSSAILDLEGFDLLAGEAATLILNCGQIQHRLVDIRIVNPNRVDVILNSEVFALTGIEITPDEQLCKIGLTVEGNSLSCKPISFTESDAGISIEPIEMKIRNGQSSSEVRVELKGPAGKSVLPLSSSEQEL